MFRTKVTHTGLCANRQERRCHARNAMDALRVLVAVVILSVSASWIAYGAPPRSVRPSAGTGSTTVTLGWDKQRLFFVVMLVRLQPHPSASVRLSHSDPMELGKVIDALYDSDVRRNPRSAVERSS